MTIEDANLKFEFSFASGELSQIELPIEIRKTDLELIGTPLSSETISIEPGTYFISAELPSGQKITSLEEIAPGDNSVTLTPDLKDMSPHESHERTHFLRTDFNGFQKQSSNFADPTMKGRARILVGNPLIGPVEDFAFPGSHYQPSFDDLNQLWKITIPGGALIPETRFLTLQFIQPHQPALNLALPRSQYSGCELIVTSSPMSAYRVSVQLENLEADLLLRYREESLFGQLDVLSRSTKVDPEILLERKMEDPIAAAVGAYNILKVGELERLHDWTENLKNRLDWLPDGASIRGEHLARLGRHEEALTAFLLLSSRGLPFFSDGFNYALDRLRLYRASESDSFGNPNIRGQVEALLHRLETFEPYVDFGKAVMTFTGLDLERPDDRPVHEIPPEMSFDFEF